MNKSCVIYHGLGSKPALSRISMMNKKGYITLSEKFDYEKEWDLDKGRTLFQNEYNKINKIDLIIGISFGGYLAYKLSKATGVDVLLINPAINRDKSKSKIGHFDIEMFDKKSNIEVFFGEFDTAVPKENTIQFLNNIGEDYVSHIIKDMAHRIPDIYFKQILKQSIIINK